MLTIVEASVRVEGLIGVASCVHCFLHRLHVVRTPSRFEPVERVARLWFAQRGAHVCASLRFSALLSLCV